MNTITLHCLYVPRFTSPKLGETIDNPKKDSASKTYKTKFIPISAKNNELKALFKNNELKVLSKTDYNKAAALVDLVHQMRANGQSDNTKGLKNSKVINPITGHLLAIKHFEVDHFHPKNGADGFITRMDEADKNMAQRSPAGRALVSTLKKNYPVKAKEPGRWQFSDFIIETGQKKGNLPVYKIKNSYRIRVYNYIDNLWLICGAENKSFGDRHKIPKSGDSWKTSPLAESAIYGQDFLKLFGTVDNAGIFKREYINSEGVIDMATFELNLKTGKHKGSTLTGLGKIARDWFTYRYSQISGPKKTLALKVEKLNQIVQRLVNVNSNKKEESKLKKQLNNIMAKVAKQADLL